VLDSTPGDKKQKIIAAIDRLSAGGSTAGGEGIELAYRVAVENFLEGGVNRVILGTDGDFNVGVQSESELVALIEQKRKTGVFLTVLGFGMGNLKDSTLEKLAQHGNGHYAYIDDEREARKVFVEQGGSLVVVAKDVKLQVEFNPRRVGAYRLVGYENRLMRDQDFRDDTKDAGDMGSGHTVTAFYEIIPPGEPIPEPGVDKLKYQLAPKLAPAADSDEWLTVKLRYKDPEASKSKELSQSLGGPALKLADASADFRFASAVAAFGMLLRDSSYRGDSTFAAVREQAGAALGRDPGKHRAGFLELVEAAQKLKGAK
jgi:Ca-activated chloride channel family protein